MCVTSSNLCMVMGNATAFATEFSSNSLITVYNCKKIFNCS